MPCVQIAGHRPALEECARWRSPTVAAAVKSPSSALVPAARLPGSASWAFSGDLLHGAEPPPSSRRASPNPHSASRTLGAPPSAISSLGQLPTPAVARVEGSLSPGRVDEDVAILIPHSPGCAAFPLPVLHGRVSLAKV